MFCSSLPSRIQLIIIIIKTAIGEVIIFLNLAFISLGNDRAPLSGVRERWRTVETTIVEGSREQPTGPILGMEGDRPRPAVWMRALADPGQVRSDVRVR